MCSNRESLYPSPEGSPAIGPSCGALSPEAGSLEHRVENLLRQLLLPQNRAELEQFRFPGSTNRVYRIPLSPGDEEFIVVKVLPGRRVEFIKRAKRLVRNLLYGEHDVSTGHKRAQMELERNREWQAEGIPVPPLVETSIPQVRVFQGLRYPTFFSILTSEDITTRRKLQVLAAVSRALSEQHEKALERGKKSLVHRDPGPWNIMFDLEREHAWWFDLEHPAEYRDMTLEGLMVRAVRIFFYGVLDHLGGRLDEVVPIVADNYRLRPVLQGFADNVSHLETSPLRYLMRRAWGRETYQLRLETARRVAEYLQNTAKEEVPASGQMY